SGRLIPNDRYHDRYALTEALLPIVRTELEALVQAGCREVTVDEPSMSCYAHREGPARFVDIFNRTVEPVAGRCRLSTHLCFGNAPAGRLSLAPDCGLSQTARWAARAKLRNMVAGVRQVREELGV